MCPGIRGVRQISRVPESCLVREPYLYSECSRGLMLVSGTKMIY